MNGFRFLNYQVYKDSKTLLILGNRFVALLINKRKYVFSKQLERALLSIVLNIAEGSVRLSDREFSRYLEISLGSLNECVACVDLLMDQKIIEQIFAKKFINLAEKIAKQIQGLRKTMIKNRN